MRKIICLLLLAAQLLAVLSLSSCGNNSGEGENGTDSTGTTASTEAADQPAALSLGEIMDKVLMIDYELPSFLREDQTSEYFNFNYEFGIDQPEGVKEVLISKPVQGIQPVSIGLIRLEEGVDAEALARQIESSVDPARLICGVSTFVKTVAREDVIILVMDDNNDRGQAVIDAFNAL